MITQDPKEPLWEVTIRVCTSSKLEDTRQIVDGIIFVGKAQKATEFGPEHVITCHAKDEKTASDYVAQQNPLAQIVSPKKVS